MLSTVNAFHISHQRLKYKKTLTYITIFISSLAISTLLLFVSFSSGLIKSINTYVADSLDNEFLVHITPNVPSHIYGLPKYNLTSEQVDDIKAFEKSFSPTDTMLIPSSLIDETAISGYVIKYSSPNYERYLTKLQTDYVKTATNNLSSLESSKTNLSINNIYKYLSRYFSKSQLHFIGEDKNQEDLSDIEQKPSYDLGAYDTDTKNSHYSLIEDKLVEKFLFKNLQRDPTAIPVIITREEGEQLFKDRPLNGLIYYACLRKNPTDIKKCNDSQFLKFQVVGIIPLQKFTLDQTSNINDLFNNIVNIRFNSGALIPFHSFKKLSNYNTSGKLFFDDNVDSDILAKNHITSHIISFKNLSDARQFLDHHSCKNRDTSCTKPWYSEVFGLNYLLINDFSTKINQIKALIIIVSIIILFLIFSLMIIKLIIESRKDSAIFRAIGAKKSDILKIYLSLSFIVATRIIITSIILTFTAIFIINQCFSAKIINDLVSRSGFPNVNFSLFTIDLSTSLLIIVNVYIISLIATIPTALTNIKRNIISDIKHE